MSTSPAASEQRPDSWIRILAEVAGVWAIALAWPIYSSIASGTEALTSYGVRRPDLLLLIFIVSLLGPLLITLGELAIRLLFSERLRRAVHSAVIGALLGLILWQWLFERDSPVVLNLLAPLLVFGLIVWLYARSEFIRNFVQVLSFATVVVIAVFCLSYPIKEEILPHEAGAETSRIESDTPIVMVVFDEFPLDVIEQPDGSVDPRFKNLSMLSRKANWYPGALSVGDQTTRAMPSILTGTEPYEGKGWKPPPPGLAEYPDSICRIAESGGYKVHSYEPVTDLCDQNWDLGSRVTGTIRRAVANNPSIAPVSLAQKAAAVLNLPFDMPWNEYSSDRPKAIDSFIEGLTDNPRQVSILHIALPHVSWLFSPDGSTYQGFRSLGDRLQISPGFSGELERDAQQMMLQTVYTDNQLGRIIDRIKENGLWDDSLFVVTADHGAAFNPLGSRRVINPKNAGWIAPIPLFIKFPGQESGRVVPGTVDGRDIVPTLLSALGVAPSEDLRGRDLTGRKRLPQRDKHLVSTPRHGHLELDLAKVRVQQRRAISHFNKLFTPSFFTPAGRADLLGKTPDGMQEVPVEPLDASDYDDVDLDSGEIPAYFEARVDPNIQEPPKVVALTLNGRIAATARPWPEAGGWRVGSMLPTAGFHDGKNQVRVYEVKVSD